MKQSGFTLLELLVAISIFAIISGLAVPSFQDSMERTRSKTHTNLFYSALVTARSEAVKRNLPVVLCTSADGAQCLPSNQWEQGWLIFVDSNSNGSLDSGESIIQVNEALDNSTLRSVNNTTNTLIYHANGTHSSDESFNLCVNSDVNEGKSIYIELTGRPGRSSGASTCPA